MTLVNVCIGHLQVVLGFDCQTANESSRQSLTSSVWMHLMKEVLCHTLVTPVGWWDISWLWGVGGTHCFVFSTTGQSQHTHTYRDRIQRTQVCRRLLSRTSFHAFSDSGKVLRVIKWDMKVKETFNLKLVDFCSAFWQKGQSLSKSSLHHSVCVSSPCCSKFSISVLFVTPSAGSWMQLWNVVLSKWRRGWRSTWTVVWTLWSWRLNH